MFPLLLSYSLTLTHIDFPGNFIVFLMYAFIQYNFPWKNIASYDNVVLHLLATDRKLLVIELIAANVTWFKDNFVEIACI